MVNETTLVQEKKAVQFLKEMKEELEKQYASYVEYQKLASKVFSVFHELCIKNDIPYYLAFGTLLGAVRDGGQIPWDYDIDVFVPFTQAQRLLQVLDQQLPEEYYYDTRLKNKKCRHYSIKMAPKGYNCTILHLDIFWLVGESADRKKQKQHRKIRDFFFNKFLYKYHDIGIKGEKTRPARVAFYLKRIYYGLFPSWLVEHRYRKVISLPLKEGGWCSTSGGGEAAFCCSWFGKPKRVVLPSGQEVCLPEDSESILTSLFGDFHQFPPIRDRMEEFHNSLMRLKEFAKKEQYEQHTI